MTKKKLLQLATELTQQYLGFPIAGVYGLNSKPKTEVEQYVTRMQRANLYKTLASEYAPSSRDGLYQMISGDISARHNFYLYLKEIAQKLYWGLNEQVSVEEAYDKYYRAD